MGSPTVAHESLLPTTEKPRFPCDTCDKTFASTRNRQEHLLRYGHVVNQPIPIHVPFYLHLRQQNIKCPLCKFKAKSVKSPRSFITHFTHLLGQYELTIEYTCTICSEVMTGDDVQDHLLQHQCERIPLTPTLIRTPSFPLLDESPTTSSKFSPSTVSSPESYPVIPPSPVPSAEPSTPTSSPMPDTQKPFSPLQPSPPRLSPSPSTATNSHDTDDLFYGRPSHHPCS